MTEAPASDLLILMAVDRTTLYGYFEVTVESLAAARRRAGRAGDELTLVLRLHTRVGCVHGLCPATVDHVIADRVGSRYLRIDPGVRSARMAVGVRTPGGRFFAAAWSAPLVLCSTAVTPPGPAPVAP